MGESLPSAVWLDPGGQLVVGRDAERQARLAADRFEPTPKLRVGEGRVLLGDVPVPVVNLLAGLLGQVLTEARRVLGDEPDQLVLTHPAAWGPSRREVLVDAARIAGARCPVRLVPEPVAAAARFVTLPHVSLRPGQSLAVLDVGGGTTDVAVVQAGTHGWEVLADGGADIGGRDLDFELTQHIRTGDPVWTEVDRPTTPAARRVARTLTEDVRAAKEALSRYAHTDIPMPPPLPDGHVTRGEFEALVRPLLTKVVDVLVAVVARARPGQLAGVFLVGGSTRVPLLATMVRERTGMRPVVLESPETVVALGALLTEAPPLPPVHQPVPQPTWTPPRNRRRLPLVVAIVVVVVIGLVTTLLLTSNSSEADKPLPNAPDAGARNRRGLFTDDPELLRIAVPAVDNALACVNAKGLPTDKFTSRTQVRCQMRSPAGYDLLIEFMSGSDTSPCDNAYRGIGFDASENGTWSGNGRTGTWEDVAFAPLDGANDKVHGVFFRTDNGTTCAVLNTTTNSLAVGGKAVHSYWIDAVRPNG